MPLKPLSATEATARLPFVSAAAADARDLSVQIRTAQAAYEAEKRRPLPSQVVLNDGSRVIRRLRHDVDLCLADVASAGATLADPVAGIIDFPGEVEGVEEGTVVRLCWRLGEDRVEYWHGDDEDHGRRRPLPEPVHA